MGLAVLDDKHLTHVPGTTQFSKDPNAAAAELYEGVNLSALKHDAKNPEIILIPQPSDDPNDPLNWSKLKRNVVFFTLIYGTILAGALGPIVSAAQVELAATFEVSLQSISIALGTSLVTTLAISTVIWSALSAKIGKRPVYLVASVFMFIGVIISSEAKNYGMLLGSRIIQGVGQAPLEFLVGASINDLFHSHEKGWPIALWTIALLNGINITPPISGVIYERLGFRWNFRVFAIAVAVLFILQIFACPETTYDRSGYVPKAVVAAHHGDDDLKLQEERIESGAGATTPPPPPAKNSWLSELALFHGTFEKDRSFGFLVWQPATMLISPVVIWAIFLYGVAITFLVVIATGAAQIYFGVYAFSPGGVGNTYCAALLADFLAALLYGPLADFTASRMSRMNGGIFEPEFTLPPIIFYLVFGGGGLLGFGMTARADISSWASIIFFGILNFGITIGCSAAVAYVVECHRHTGEPAMGAVVFGKNAVSALVTAFTNNWLDTGIRNAFIVMAAVAVATSLSTIPMYIYGKRARSWIHRTLHYEHDAGVVET